ncbi:E3 ubiquitin-protein ligase UPL1-like [Iris pallida]|uniref:E3 ubiquitin-protein ligase UPL1-like n=1 Tax=Iris pallida TaxID=29817 RepID=A0AAX6EUP9_IRIPA|nr:E3 ubiquitin-protein ligase UPL1-like [Iris pallida]
MDLLQVVVNNAVSRVDSQTQSGQAAGITETQASNGAPSNSQRGSSRSEQNQNQEFNSSSNTELPPLSGNKSLKIYDIVLQLSKPDMRNLCSILENIWHRFDLD